MKIIDKFEILSMSIVDADKALPHCRILAVHTKGDVMSEQQTNEVQSPDEQYRVDTNVETEKVQPEQTEPAPVEVNVQQNANPSEDTGGGDQEGGAAETSDGDNS